MKFEHLDRCTRPLCTSNQDPNSNYQMAFVLQCLPSEASLPLYFSVLLPRRSSLRFRYPSGFTSSTKHHLILNSCKQSWALPHLTLTASFISTAVEQITPTLTAQTGSFFLSVVWVERGQLGASSDTSFRSPGSWAQMAVGVVSSGRLTPNLG